MADTLRFCFYGSFQHVRVTAFGKYDTLRVAACRVIELAGKLGFLSHEFAEMCFVSIPVFDILTGYAAFHSSTGYGDGNFRYQTWIYRFRYEVFRAEREIVYMISFIYHIGYRLLGQIGNCVYGSYFHLFVDRFCLRIQSTTEDIRETDYVVNLIRIIGTSGCHQHVRTGGHGIFIRDFRCRIGQGEYDRRRSHTAYHVLRQHVAFRQA